MYRAVSRNCLDYIFYFLLIFSEFGTSIFFKAMALEPAKGRHAILWLPVGGSIRLESASIYTYGGKRGEN
jgi:hypothetical protein